MSRIVEWKKLLGLFSLSVFAFLAIVLFASTPSRADGPCPAQTIPFPSSYPITSAGLMCDSSGNLNVNVKVGGGGGGGGGSNVTIVGGTAGATPVPVSLSTTVPVSLTSIPPVTFSSAQPVTLTGSVAVTGTFWQATQPVSGTFWQATQPVSGTIAATQSGTWNIGAITTLPSIPTGTNSIGAVTQGGTWSNVGVTGTFWQATQPVSLASVPPVVFASAQPVTFPSAQPVAITSNVPIVFASAQPVTFPSAQPVTFPSAQPVTIASSAPVTQSGTWTVQPGNTQNTTPWLTTDDAPILARLISSSATTCTNLSTTVTHLVSIVNVGTATVVFPQFYNDAGTTCATTTQLYGDGATVVLGAGQILTFKMRLPSAGLAYKLSSALTSGQQILINAY
jgi:hypothetical protein